MEFKPDSVITYNKAWHEIDPQDWPSIPGAIFITIDKNIPTNGSKFIVSMWVDDPHENVTSLGTFWRLKDAQLFANAKLEST